jgi:hypothetical protein
MNSKQITVVIDRDLHHRVKMAAAKRRMEIQAFMDYVIRKGLNLTTRKQP